MSRIAIVRHGHKEGDALTTKGMKQIEEISQALLNCGFIPNAILYSPTHRTKQCAQISREVFGLDEMPIQENLDLSPESPIMQTFATEEAFEEELQMIMHQGGTVADALRLGKYPVVGQRQLVKFLRQQSLPTVLCFSHACFSTLGFNSDLPYCAPEASCVIYNVQDGVIKVERFIIL